MLCQRWGEVMKTYAEKEAIRKILKAVYVSTNLQEYKDILDEMERLWDLEHKARIVFLEFPRNGQDYYPAMKLEDKIRNKLALTKELMEMLK